MGKLLGALPRAGEVVWIGLRPARRAPMRVVSEAEARPGEGLVGDRFSGTPDSIRQVTLIQAEHLPAVASLAGLPEVDPALLRRNLVIKGINLLALKEQRFWVGEALLETTGLCHPCSRMEEALGEGGYNAVRGHGGITARVLRGGPIRLGDAVSVEKEGMPNRAV
ncbi:MAG: MOSC domain-containing protein [Ferruginibacter sp.]|nr:MOSC domain-containing protein [Cytophagales bacterium]